MQHVASQMSQYVQAVCTFTLHFPLQNLTVNTQWEIWYTLYNLQKRDHTTVRAYESMSCWQESSMITAQGWGTDPGFSSSCAVTVRLEEFILKKNPGLCQFVPNCVCCCYCSDPTRCSFCSLVNKYLCSPICLSDSLQSWKLITSRLFQNSRNLNFSLFLKIEQPFSVPFHLQGA